MKELTANNLTIPHAAVAQMVNNDSMMCVCNNKQKKKKTENKKKNTFAKGKKRNQEEEVDVRPNIHTHIPHLSCCECVRKRYEEELSLSLRRSCR